MLTGELFAWFGDNLWVDSGLFMPHGQCYLWDPKLVALQVISDMLTGLSYYAIPIILIVFVLKRKDAPFPKIFWMFGAFIIACGTTHFMSVWTLWNPDYWVEGGVKLVTGIVSFATAAMLIPAVPKALAMPRPEEFQEANRRMQQEIEERKRAEQQVKQLNADLERKIQDLKASNEELQKFSYSVSHDLRAPLRSIDGFSQALLESYEQELDETGKHYLQRVRRSSQKMGYLIDDILKLSRISRAELNITEIDLSQITRSIFEDLKRDHPERKTELYCEDGLILKADHGMMENVMQNLLDNAWKFSANNDITRIEVGSETQEGRTVYYVNDNGAGFDETYYDKLFAPFQRLHSTTEYEGTGIGLANIQRIIRRHNGEIWAQSKPGKGTTFYFYLNVEIGEENEANPKINSYS